MSMGDELPWTDAMYMSLKEGFQKLDLIMVEGLVPETDPQKRQPLSSVWENQQLF